MRSTERSAFGRRDNLCILQGVTVQEPDKNLSKEAFQQFIGPLQYINARNDLNVPEKAPPHLKTVLWQSKTRQQVANIVFL